MFLDELPRNATGKVLKKDLAAEDGAGQKQSSGNGKKTQSKGSSEAKETETA